MVRLRDLSHVRIDRVEYPSAGGTVRGLYYSMEGVQTCVVLCHGYSSSKHNVDPLAFHLAADGYAALAFDFLGHKLGASTGPLREGADLVTNALDACAVARRREGIEHLVIGGHSMGAATAIGAAVANADIEGVIAMATSTGRSRQLTDDTMLSGLRNRTAYVEGADPDSITTAMDRYTDRVGDVAPRPILIIAAQRDALVPPSAVKRLFDDAREPKTFDIVDANHTDCAERSRFVVSRWLRARGFPSAQP
ncbi:MAG TPA: alpha/beta fold hydrolase [Candidatus Eremiobacteraceae bacterium]|nr:alpha/beta fold hydrolase [Candidatus Eremiobacteraceae bacterium]